tara:strand:+ start:2498 stop:2689 length:192 start_codon:yes stop_codon:yes gene_type:complete
MDDAGANPYAAIVPKFNFEQAVRLFWKGRSMQELIDAAKRLGDDKLEQDLRKFFDELEGDMNA